VTKFILLIVIIISLISDKKKIAVVRSHTRLQKKNIQDIPLFPHLLKMSEYPTELTAMEGGEVRDIEDK
jgi:hypothetical protein